MTDERSEYSPHEEQEDDVLGVSQETIRSLEDALEEHQFDRVREIIADLHAADIAVVISYLSPEVREDLVDLLRPQFNAEILNYLDESLRVEVADRIGMRELAKALKNLESDDALEIIEGLEEHQQIAVLKGIPAGERVILEEVLTYPEDSAARMMQREIVCVPSFWTVSQTIEFIAKEEDFPDAFYEVFVVDPKHTPVGTVPLGQLFRHPKKSKIAEIMDRDVKKIPATMDQSEVAMLFRKYGMVAAPVVDEADRIIGMITVDDVVDVIDEEAEKEILHLSRLTESDFYSPVFETSYSRLRWLLFTMINTILAATVISQFEDTIQNMVALAILMPITAAMGGNSGMQVITVTVRALATKELGSTNMWRVINKEMLVGLLNGIFCGFLLGGLAGLWFHELSLGIVLSAAMVFNMLWAACAGTILPIMIDRMGWDPAISAGPLLTTTTDVIGFSVFLGLAKLFL